jgi:hypothetical protein
MVAGRTNYEFAKIYFTGCIANNDLSDILNKIKQKLPVCQYECTCKNGTTRIGTFSLGLI